MIGALDEQAVADNLTQRPLTENLNYVAALASERLGKRELREYVGNIASLSGKAGAEAYISLTVNHPEFGKIGSIQSTHLHDPRMSGSFAGHLRARRIPDRRTPSAFLNCGRINIGYL